MLLISGEPGIGKTRLVEEFIGDLDSVDSLMFWGRCEALKGSPAYWAWTQILDPLVATLGDDLANAPDNPGWASLDEILSVTAVKTDGSVARTHLPSDRARFDVFRTVSRLVQIAATKPLILILDDIHWADSASLALLQHVAATVQSHPILLLATYRRHDVGCDTPLSATLAAIARESACAHLTLHALSNDHVRQYLLQVLQRMPEERVLDAVVRAVGGNAFFMREMVWLMLTSNSDDGSEAGPKIPDSVRNVVRQRLSTLPRGCRETLGAASVAGRVVSLSTLAKATGRSISSVVTAVEPAIQAGLVESETPGSDTVRFSHALVHEVLYQDLPAMTRMSLHQSIGNELERRFGTLDTSCAEIALHFGRSLPLGQADKAIHYAIRAAEDALSRHAWESAADYCQAALRAIDSEDTLHPATRCDALLLLGEAQTLAGAGREHAFLSGTAPLAVETYWQTARLAEQSNLPVHLARAAIGLAGVEPGTPQSGIEGIQLMDRALAMLPADDSTLRAQLLARSAVDTARL